MRDSGNEVAREIRQEYFPERPLHRSLQKSNRSTTDKEFTASSFSRLLGRHDGRVSKSDGTLTHVWVHGPGFSTCLVMTGNAYLVTSWRTKDSNAGIEEINREYF